MPPLGNTGKQRGCTYIKQAEHVVKELLTLQGNEFNERKLVIEKAKTQLIKTTGENMEAFRKT